MVYKSANSALEEWQEGLIGKKVLLYMVVSTRNKKKVVSYQFGKEIEDDTIRKNLISISEAHFKVVSVEEEYYHTGNYFIVELAGFTGYLNDKNYYSENTVGSFGRYVNGLTIGFRTELNLAD